MKSFLLFAGLILISHQAIAQIITCGDTGSDKIDPTKIEKWTPDQKNEYQATYHFGFSDFESLLFIIIANDSCYAQIRDGYWTTTNGEQVWIRRYETLKNVRIEGNKFYSDKTNGEFVIYNLNNKKTKGLIVYNPWSRPKKEGISELGFYQGTVQVWYNGRFPYASYRFLNEVELEKMSLQDLKIMRNEIYARYEFIFTQGGEMDNYFRNQKWYGGNNKNVDSFMTGLEKQNIQLIQKIEKK